MELVVIFSFHTIPNPGNRPPISPLSSIFAKLKLWETQTCFICSRPSPLRTEIARTSVTKSSCFKSALSPCHPSKPCKEWKNALSTTASGFCSCFSTRWSCWWLSCAFSASGCTDTASVPAKARSSCCVVFGPPCAFSFGPPHRRFSIHSETFSLCFYIGDRTYYSSPWSPSLHCTRSKSLK